MKAVNIEKIQNAVMQLHNDLKADELAGRESTESIELAWACEYLDAHINSYLKPEIMPIISSAIYDNVVYVKFN